MISFEKALEIAKKENGILGIRCAFEADEFWTFPTAEVLDIGTTIAVRKDNGAVFHFFPPDYSVEFIKSMKKITL